MPWAYVGLVCTTSLRTLTQTHTNLNQQQTTVICWSWLTSIITSVCPAHEYQQRNKTVYYYCCCCCPGPVLSWSNHFQTLLGDYHQVQTRLSWLSGFDRGRPLLVEARWYSWGLHRFLAITWQFEGCCCIFISWPECLKMLSWLYKLAEHWESLDLHQQLISPHVEPPPVS